MEQSGASKSPRDYRKPTEEDRRAARAEFVAGKGWSTDIAARYGLNPTTVKGWVIDGQWMRLRERRDRAELDKIEQGLAPEQSLPAPEPDEVSILTGHLAVTDRMLEDCQSAKDREQLTRARAVLSEQLWIAKYGSKPGTQRPARTRTRPGLIPLNPVEPDQPSTPQAVYAPVQANPASDSAQ